MLVGAYESMGDISERLLRALPPLLSLANDQWDSPLVSLLCNEVVKDEPGQAAVLDRLRDLLLIAVLRAWFARPEAKEPAWYRSQGDPVVGRALSLMHKDPAQPWTVASLATELGVSRAALARRFHDVVGEPPMTFLTGWRLALAADLVARLDDEQVDYAVAGTIALVAHGYRRFTEGVDILLSPEGLRRFRKKLQGLGYLPAFEGATKTFRDTRTRIKIEVLTSGDYPGDGKPKPVAFPDPIEARVDRDDLWVIGLEKLVELKLASGLTAPHRLKDLADVQELILHLRLPLTLSESLDPSVSAEYTRLWQAAAAGRATGE